MITHKDIKDFFDYEAESSKTKWDNLMKLSVEERIRKRKTIQNVFLDKQFEKYSIENNRQIKLTFTNNLSDFKVGSRVLLHHEHSLNGIPCEIVDFEDENTIIAEIFHPNIPSNWNIYYDCALLLDDQYLDLREKVFNKFLFELPDDNNFWSKHIITNRHQPTFNNRKQCEIKLDDTIINFKLNLLPSQREAILNSMATSDYYLIQGPPGTGKSFVLGIIILEEILYFNHKVIIIGPNHMAINNTLSQIFKLMPYENILKIGQKYNAPTITQIIDGNKLSILNCEKANWVTINDVDLYSTTEPLAIGLYPYYLYTSRARGLECDTLIIDEAGQMTIPLALMGMIKAKKVIFAGDHKQLPPIITSDEIPEKMRQSIFQHLKTDENCTLLNTSFRMCKTICNFVSEIFYDNKIESIKQEDGSLLICDNPLYSFDTPIVFQHINDDGKQTSNKEAEFISNTIINYINLGISPEDIAVLSPFRAQIANIKRHLRKTKSLDDDVLNRIAIDTIDKMQGQEREIIFLTLVSGDIEYMTEMADFLYNPNKLNVAFSRAKSKLIIVGNMERLKEIDRCTFPHIHKMLESEYIHII